MKVPIVGIGWALLLGGAIIFLRYHCEIKFMKLIRAINEKEIELMQKNASLPDKQDYMNAFLVSRAEIDLCDNISLLLNWKIVRIIGVVLFFAGTIILFVMRS